MSSLNVLIEKYAAQIKELEARLAETGRKLEIVSEAFRLLVEEGLSDEFPPIRSDEDMTYKEATPTTSLESEGPDASDDEYAPGRSEEDMTYQEASAPASAPGEGPDAIGSRQASVLRLAESLRARK